MQKPEDIGAKSEGESLIMYIKPYYYNIKAGYMCIKT
jgi:hypothetical protein